MAMGSPSAVFLLKFPTFKTLFSPQSQLWNCFFSSKSHIMDLQFQPQPTSPRNLHCSSFSTPPSPHRESHRREFSSESDWEISLEEWQAWGPTSPVPSIVTDAISYLKSVESQVDAQMCFGGNGGRFIGDFKQQEDKKHRMAYASLNDSESKFQFFSARQIACRLLGSRGYLCQKCWLAGEDCMCKKISPRPLWNRIRLWVYMHPKDFLRQNNTGKVLWQLFGVHSATLCLFGINEQEDLMWNELAHAGKDNVWCLYPSKSTGPQSVQDYFSQGSLASQERSQGLAHGSDTLNFISIDGTWNNSAAMVRRLKDRANIVWGEEDISCISLSMGASTMHRLRPQPSWDRTCTAAAAAGLLSELHLIPRFSPYGLDKEADAIEDSLEILLEALTARRLRTGRSITRNSRSSYNM